MTILGMIWSWNQETWSCDQGLPMAGSITSQSPHPSRDAAGPARAGRRTARRPVPERLLEAALATLQTHGFAGLTQARVAAAAGLRQSHLTYYFPTRKDLLQALVEAVQTRMTQALSGADAAAIGPPGIDAVRRVFVRTIRDPLVPRAMVALLNAADEDPSLRRWLARFDARMHALLRHVFARLGLRPDADALWLLHASFVGAAVLALHAPQPSAARRSGRLVRLAFDRAVAASTPRPERR